MKYTFKATLRESAIVDDIVYPRYFELTVIAKDDDIARNYSEYIAGDMYELKIIKVEAE